MGRILTWGTTKQSLCACERCTARHVASLNLYLVERLHTRENENEE